MLKKDMQEKIKCLEKYKKRYDLLTGKSKFKTFQDRTDSWLRVLADTQKRMEEYRHPLNPKNIGEVLSFLMKRELITPTERFNIFKRWRAYGMERRMEKGLDITLSGIDKIYEKYKEEIKLSDVKVLEGDHE